MSPTSPATRAIASLHEAGHTLREIEGLVGLSRGYLSKIRHGAVQPSAPLVALLEVLAAHPEAFETLRAERDDVPARAAPTGSALETLRELVPALVEAGVRWAVTGHEALRQHVPEAGERPGVDILVDPRDRRVLELLRARGHALAHHPPALAICRVGAPDPNESLRVHFPSRPPLLEALDHAVVRDGLPTVDLTTLTLANLLSQRSGSEEAAALGIRGGASIEALRARLDALATLPEPLSPYILRTFDRTLARKRLDALA